MKIHYRRKPTHPLDDIVIIHPQHGGRGFLVWTNARELVTCERCRKLLGLPEKEMLDTVRQIGYTRV